MKTNKALKRLSKIETLMSIVAERYSSGESHIREMLQDAKAAVVRVKEAVSLQVSSAKAKNPARAKRKASKGTPRRHRAQKRAAVATADQASRKAVRSRKKATAKKAAMRMPIKKAARKIATKKSDQIPLTVS